MGGGSIKKLTQKRSINFTTETLETLDKLAAKNHTTTSELVRGYVEKGLSIEGSREDIDFIARIQQYIMWTKSRRLQIMTRIVLQRCS